MASSRLILSGVAVAAIVAAIVAGAIVSQKTILPEQRLEQSGLAPVTADPANVPLFQVSAPSRGHAYSSIPITLGTKAGSKALVFVDAGKAATIKPGQSVLLYDAEKRLLNILGHVAGINAGRGDMKDISAITLKLQTNPEIPADLAVTGEIITQKFNQAQRLPSSALVTNPDGKNYVWEAMRKPDGTATAAQREVSFFAPMEPNFFVFETAETESGLYLLSPGPDLTDGQIIRLEEATYTAPAMADDDRIAALKYDRLFRPSPENMVEVDMPAGCAAVCNATGKVNYIDQILGLAKKQQQEMDAPAP